jgi:hypothetical protein
MHTGPKDYLNADQYDASYPSSDPPKREPTDTSRWSLGDFCRVVAGPHTGAMGSIDFIDREGGRALINVSGRFGGLTWVRLQDIHVP